MPTGPLPEKRPFSHWLGIFVSGACMGAADVVPGISGGTVAFILGIYPELLRSLNSFNGHAFKLFATMQLAELMKAVQWKFLLCLIAGAVVSFFSLAQIFSEILVHETNRTYLYSAFLGLILASVWFCAKQLDSWKSRHLLAFILGVFSAYALTAFSWPSEGAGSLYDIQIDLNGLEKAPVNYRDSHLLDVPESILSAMLAKGVVAPDTLVRSHSSAFFMPANEIVSSHDALGLDVRLIACGAVAVCAMLLPGISGSYLLTILGVYGVAIAALADFVQGLKNGSFETEAFLLLASMSIGIVLGALLFSRVVSWVLQRYHDATIATLTGFMVGALGTIWPFWSHQYVFLPLKLEKGPQLQVVSPIFPDLNSPLFYKAALFALIGFSAVFILERIAKSGFSLSAPSNNPIS